METPAVYQCPRCGARVVKEFKPVFTDVRSGWRLDVAPPPVNVKRHKPCGAVVWVPTEIEEVAYASTQTVLE